MCMLCLPVNFMKDEMQFLFYELLIAGREIFQMQNFYDRQPKKVPAYSSDALPSINFRLYLNADILHPCSVSEACRS